jgi:TRAP-type C4-dicarboxylate transport system permease small subunit
MLNTVISTAALARRGVAGIGRAMGYVSGWGFIAISGLITFDVLARRFLGFSTQATTELSGYALAFGISWALAHTLSMRAHVRIDLLVNKFPDRIRYWLHLVSLVMLGIFIGYLTYGSINLVGESLLFKATDISVLRVPLAIPQGLWAFGIAVTMLLIILMVIENAALILAGRGSEAEAMLHTRTFQEEVAEALEAVGDPSAHQAPAAQAPSQEPRP